MIFQIFKKIISGILIISFIIPSFTILPKKVEAQWAVFDAGNVVQSTITAGNTTLASASTYSMQLKEFVLDGVLNVIVKQLIRQLTQSIVNWINSGFEGSPSFLQNPGAFFLDVADQITGAFLAKYGGPLTMLCSQFSLDINIALRFRYHPSNMKRYTCTLNTIVKNTKNAVDNASINGTKIKNIDEQGWPNFISLSTEPQNNIYGAYIQAETDLSWRVARERGEQRQEINNGRGFLSWKKCKSDGSAEAARAEQDLKSAQDADEEAYAQMEVNKHQTCEIQTPGSVISDQLNLQLGSGLRQLEIADEINEIVNALVAQLMTQVLTKGLGTVSGSGPQDSNSYINNLNNGENSTSEIDTMRAQILSSTEIPAKLTGEYVEIKKQTYEVYSSINTSYQNTINCTDKKIASAQSDWMKAELERNKSEAIKALENIKTVTDQLKTTYDKAVEKLNTIYEIRNIANSAKTFKELKVAAEKLAPITTSMNLTSYKDIQDAKEMLATTKASAANSINDSRTKLEMCNNSY